MIYIQIVGAMIFGSPLFFDERPNVWTLIGIMVIMGSGLFLWQSAWHVN